MPSEWKSIVIRKYIFYKTIVPKFQNYCTIENKI